MKIQWHVTAMSVFEHIVGLNHLTQLFPSCIVFNTILLCINSQNMVLKQRDYYSLDLPSRFE